MGHRALLYTVRAKRLRKDDYPPLGDLDGAGTRLADVLPGFVADDDPIVGEDEEKSIVCEAVDARFDGDETDDVYLSLRHGEKGIAAVIVDPGGGVKTHQRLVDTSELRCGALFILKRTQEVGWLAVHMNGGRGVVGLLIPHLEREFAERFDDLRLLFKPYVDADVLRQAVLDGHIKDVRLTKTVRADDPADAAVSEWVPKGNAGKIEVVFKPPRGKDKFMDPGPLQSYIEGSVVEREAAITEIPAQREACKRRVAALGAVLVEEFVDRGESGTTIRRPELQRMLAYVKENAITYVVVHKIDRLARNLADDVTINLALKAAGSKLESVTENIGESPSGKLMHALLSGMAEFYSGNLALEVVKGSTQKAKNGGTIGKAPLGYLNVRKIEGGREVRTVEVDPVRGPLMQWAFEAYATGDWTLRPLLDELTNRGLTAPPGRKTPEKRLELSHFHKLLRHPYYKGLVRYRGVEYQGKHTPLVSEATWDRVQQMLASKNQAGEKQRVHHHYLKGSLFCGSCGSRMIIDNARNRHGQVYPYFVCLGRHQKRTDCTFKAVLIETVEEKVIEHYETVQINPKTRDMIEMRLSEDFAALREEVIGERKTLEKHKNRLLAERKKVLQAHYAEAVPLDLLRTEQARIADQLAYIEQRFAATDEHEAEINFNLRRTLELATDVQASYQASDESRRRLLNQAFFKRLTIHEDGHIESELTEVYDVLLNPTMRARAEAAIHVGKIAASKVAAEADWAALEASFNDSTHQDGRLVRPLVTLHPKRVHRSGGELELAGGFGRSTLTPSEGFDLPSFPLERAVAVADVVGKGVAEGVPVEVVGVLADELVDGAESGLDPVEVAGVGWCRYQFDVVALGVGADVGCPVAGEAVLDPVDPDLGGVGEPDQLHEREGGEAVAVRPGPDPQVVGVHVERADQVADAVATVEGRPVSLGPAAQRPAAAVAGAEAFRPLLVEADHHSVFGLLTVESEHPGRFLGVVGVGALFPAAGALQRDPVAGEDPPQMGGRDLDLLPGQVAGELGQTPARVRHPERVGTGAGDGDDPLLVVSRDPAGSPAPETRAQRLEPLLVELVDHPAHMRLVRHPHPGDLRHAHQRVRGEQDRRPLPRRGVLRSLREPLQPLPLVRSQLAHEHLRGTHRHLLRSHASRFDSDPGGPSRFPVKPFDRPH